jgi:cell wall assembly regulator SMI1
MTFTKYFDEIIKKQKEISYSFPYTLNPPASKLEIEQTEESVGFTFNNELKELFLVANGSRRTNLFLGLIPIHRLLTLTEAKNSYETNINNQEVYDQLFEDWETCEKPGRKLFPFLADYSGHTYWMDLNTDTVNYGKVYDALMSGESPFYAFESLTSMFKVIYECYADNVFYLDEIGWLESDSERFAESCIRNNPNIPYWKIFLMHLKESDFED